MLRYINPALCGALPAADTTGPSASFYYILRACGTAMKRCLCIAPIFA
jgi:hypothetical protein